MKKQKKKLKLQKKHVIIVISSVVLVIIAIILLVHFTDVNVGKIKNGKVEYIDRIVNVTKYKDKVIIEFDNNEELIDNCIMTTELYNKFKSKDPLYNISVKDYANLSTLTAKESYNINKAMQIGLVEEDTSYIDYFAKSCGFKDKKELFKYTKAVIKLANKLK